MKERVPNYQWLRLFNKFERNTQYQEPVGIWYQTYQTRSILDRKINVCMGRNKETGKLHYILSKYSQW